MNVQPIFTDANWWQVAIALLALSGGPALIISRWYRSKTSNLISKIENVGTSERPSWRLRITNAGPGAASNIRTFINGEELRKSGHTTGDALPIAVLSAATPYEYSLWEQQIARPGTGNIVRVEWNDEHGRRRVTESEVSTL